MKTLILTFLLFLSCYPVEAKPETNIASEDKSTENIKISGNLILITSPLQKYPDGSCGGFYGKGFSDIQSGLSVVIRDGNNNVIGLGRLGDGILEDRVTCRFDYEINNVPKTNFYSLEIGGRGKINVSYEELVQDNFNISTMLSNY